MIGKYVYEKDDNLLAQAKDEIHVGCDEDIIVEFNNGRKIRLTCSEWMVIADITDEI